MVLRPVPKPLLRVGAPKNTWGVGGVSRVLTHCLVGPRMPPREGGVVSSPTVCSGALRVRCHHWSREALTEHGARPLRCKQS